MGMRAQQRHRFTRRVAALGLCALPLCTAGCEREHRDFRANRGLAGAADAVRVTELRPGPEGTPPPAQIYSENRWAVAEGQRLYAWFNCAGCHAPGGGGGIGPPLRDGEWIYGSEPENIYATIVQGRARGMPAFGGRIDPADAWKLVAYVRSMAELTPADTWGGRAKHMAEIDPQRKP